MKSKLKLKGQDPVLVFTKELPTKEGYYWWTNFGEHTPVVLEVVKDYSNGGKLYAQNEEFGFPILPPEPQQELSLPEPVDEDEWKEEDGNDKYKYGDELWCYIPCPWLPNMSTQTEPDCY
jgi:hypothetical protein